MAVIEICLRKWEAEVLASLNRPMDRRRPGRAQAPVGSSQWLVAGLAIPAATSPQKTQPLQVSNFVPKKNVRHYVCKPWFPGANHGFLQNFPEIKNQ